MRWLSNVVAPQGVGKTAAFRQQIGCEQRIGCCFAILRNLALAARLDRRYRRAALVRGGYRSVVRVRV